MTENNEPCDDLGNRYYELIGADGQPEPPRPRVLARWRALGLIKSETDSATFTRDPDWLCLSALSDSAYRYYRTVRGLILDRPTAHTVVVSDQVIGDMLGKSGKSVGRARTECDNFGAVAVLHTWQESVSVPGKARPEVRTFRKLWVAHEVPRGYEGPINIFTERQRAEHKRRHVQSSTDAVSPAQCARTILSAPGTILSAPGTDLSAGGGGDLRRSNPYSAGVLSGDTSSSSSGSTAADPASSVSNEEEDEGGSLQGGEGTAVSAAAGESPEVAYIWHRLPDAVVPQPEARGEIEQRLQQMLTDRWAGSEDELADWIISRIPLDEPVRSPRVWLRLQLRDVPFGPSGSSDDRPVQSWTRQSQGRIDPPVESERTPQRLWCGDCDQHRARVHTGLRAMCAPTCPQRGESEDALARMGGRPDTDDTPAALTGSAPPQLPSSVRAIGQMPD